MSLSVHIRKKIKTGRHRFETLDVNFESEGGILALLGETGSGKSTLLRCIAGLEKPDEGSIVLNGRVLFDSLRKINVPAGKRGVVLVAQRGMDPKKAATLWELRRRKTVEENIRAAMKAARAAQSMQTGDPSLSSETIPADSREKISARERKLIASERTAELLREFHLDGIGGFYPGALSEVQRLHALLACAAAREPELILLDEPFRGLDAYGKAELAAEVKEKLAGEGSSGTQSREFAPGSVVSEEKLAGDLIFASADAEEVYAMSSQIISIAGWKSQPVQAKADFFQNPGTLSAALLSGCRNISECGLLDPFHAFSPEWGCVFVFPKAALNTERGPAGWQALPKGFCGLGIRGEDFLMRLPDGAKESDYLRFTVHVEKVEDTLTDWLVWFRNGNDLTSGKRDLLWQVPKLLIHREDIDKVKRLYVPVSKVMRLVRL